MQQRLWPAPLGVVLQGLVIGGLTSLIAFGLALVYRANRIINFAQGDLGGIPASLGVLLMLSNGLPFLLALPLSLAAALILGGLVEFVFIRRFFKAPRLILTVVTIGVSQILAVLATIMPRAFGIQTLQNEYRPPISVSFSVGSVAFNGNDIIAMLVVPVVIAALAAFFRYTNVGIAVRASAESADRAALLGVPVKRIETIVWVVATLLATVAIFLRGGILGLPIGTVLGPTILVRALAAAIAGRMEKLPTIFIASLSIGVLEAVMTFSGDTPLIEPVLFVIIIVSLLAQKATQSRVSDDQTSTWQAARDVRPLPRELRDLPEVRWGIRGLLALFAAALLLGPLLLNEGQVNLAAVVLIWAMIALSLVVLTGWAGQVSLGQMAFVAIGAVVGGYLSTSREWDIALSLIGGGVAGAVAAVVIGLPALRIRGLFLAVVTLAFGLAASAVILTTTYLPWVPAGVRIERTALFGRIALDSERRYYYFCLTMLVLIVAAVRGLRRSRTGRVMIGVRENTRGAQAYGINATSAKLVGFAVSGFVAAFAGAVFVHHQQSLGLSAYSVDQSRRAFTMVVIGGLGSIPGAFLGAFFIQGVDYFRGSFPEVVRPYLSLLTSGIGLIFVLLVLPGGFSQGFYGIRDRLLRKVAERRGLIVPSLVADMRTKSPGGITVDAPTLATAEEAEVDLSSSLAAATVGLDDLESMPSVLRSVDDGVGDVSSVATLPPRTRRRRSSE